MYKIEICYTTLLSIDNKHIVIPNGTLSNSIITNVTARDLRKLEIKVGISYDSGIQKAKEILEEILHNDEDTKDDKGMVRFVDELGENAVIMGLRVWVATDKYWSIKWRLNHISFTRTSLSLIFYFIIQILFLYPDRHGRNRKRYRCLAHHQGRIH